MSTGHGTRRGFTIIELLVVVSIIALLISILLPAIGKARDAALQTKSAANLRNLGTAHATYGADWNDRQWTVCPDDLGQWGGSWANYAAQVGCPPQMILGFAANGGQWGYFLPCSGVPNTGYGTGMFYTPNTWNLPVNGSFRLQNVKSFSNYLNGRFYDPVFYAPKDTVVLANAEQYFPLPDEFTLLPAPYNNLYQSSYAYSPAAMWAPAVLRQNGNTAFTNPNTLPGGYRSPAASQATYPDLKTRVLEHSWLQNRPNNPINQNFAGGQTPWFFNHGYNSSPVTLFFDGSVRVVSAGDAQDADKRVYNQQQAQGTGAVGLWSRTTPFGGNYGNQGTGGYYLNQAYDFLVNTSFHILTVDGIQGRDVLGVR